jgi:hypothetical protein
MLSGNIRETRRRTDVIAIFANKEAIVPLIGTVLVGQMTSGSVLGFIGASIRSKKSIFSTMGISPMWILTEGAHYNSFTPP